MKYQEELNIKLVIRQRNDNRWDIRAEYSYKDEDKGSEYWIPTAEKDCMNLRGVDYDEESYKDYQGLSNKLKDVNMFLDTQLERMFVGMDSAVRYGC